MDAEIAAQIKGIDKLTGIFGDWPSFHDAEVIDVDLQRSPLEPERDSSLNPVLTVRIHVHKMTDEVDSRGYFVLKNHTLATIRFYAVDEFEIDGFATQNVIFELTI